jgi:hypothetical protein
MELDEKELEITEGSRVVDHLQEQLRAQTEFSSHLQQEEQKVKKLLDFKFVEQSKHGRLFRIALQIVNCEFCRLK